MLPGHNWSLLLVTNGNISLFSYALVTACNVLMNLVVLEPQLIQSKDSAADRTFKFIVKNLPNLTNAGEYSSFWT